MLYKLRICMIRIRAPEMITLSGEYLGFPVLSLLFPAIYIITYQMKKLFFNNLNVSSSRKNFNFYQKLAY